jgi:hypothetical protein
MPYDWAISRPNCQFNLSNLKTLVNNRLFSAIFIYVETIHELSLHFIPILKNASKLRDVDNQHP